MSEPKDRYEQGAVEEQNTKIDAIVGNEVLGYEGSAPPEHSGQDKPDPSGELDDRLANNRPDEMR